MADTKIETKVTVTCEIPLPTPAEDDLALWSIKEQTRGITIIDCRRTLSDAFRLVDPDKKLIWDCSASTQTKMKKHPLYGYGALDEVEEVTTTCTSKEKSPAPEPEALLDPFLNHDSSNSLNMGTHFPMKNMTDLSEILSEQARIEMGKNIKK